MKSITNFLNESIENEVYLSESILDADKPVSLRAAKKEIREWILKNCILRGGKRIDVSDDFVVDCDNEVQYRNNATSTLTNGKFRWGHVNSFRCSFTQITTLEGAPEKCDVLDCQGCGKLKSLKGAPEEVGFFDCNSCPGLRNLEGAPKEVGSFDCNNCYNLISLEGAPKEVRDGFFCYSCKKLTSLEGAPEKVGDWIECWGCDNLTITDKDRRKYKIHEHE